MRKHAEDLHAAAPHKLRLFWVTLYEQVSRRLQGTRTGRSAELAVAGEGLSRLSDNTLSGQCVDQALAALRHAGVL